MKYLPITTILLWIATIIAYFYAKELLLQPTIKFPIFILLSIFLPACFWVLASEGRRVYAFVFVSIFIFNSALISYTAFRSYSFLNSLDPYKEKRIDPELVELLVTGENEEIRKTSAQIVFERHGIALPFKAAGDGFILYTPSKTDKYTLLKNKTERSSLTELKYNIIYNIDSLLFLLAIHVSIFIGLLSFLIILESPAHNSQKNT